MCTGFGPSIPRSIYLLGFTGSTRSFPLLTLIGCVAILRGAKATSDWMSVSDRFNIIRYLLDIYIWHIIPRGIWLGGSAALGSVQ